MVVWYLLRYLLSAPYSSPGAPPKWMGSFSPQEVYADMILKQVATCYRSMNQVMIEEGVITDAEFKQKLLEERPVYQRILNPTAQ